MGSSRVWDDVFFPIVMTMLPAISGPCLKCSYLLTARLVAGDVAREPYHWVERQEISQSYIYLIIQALMLVVVVGLR